MKDVTFLSDAEKVLSADVNWDPQEAFALVSKHLVEKLNGDPWKGV